MNNDGIIDLSWNHPTVHKDTDHYMTLEEVSLVLGVTRERARQIEQTALRKARRILESRGFTLDDLFH